MSIAFSHLAGSTKPHTDRAPLRLDSVYHLCWLHAKQPSTVLDQVRLSILPAFPCLRMSNGAVQVDQPAGMTLVVLHHFYSSRMHNLDSFSPQVIMHEPHSVSVKDFSSTLVSRPHRDWPE